MAKASRSDCADRTGRAKGWEAVTRNAGTVPGPELGEDGAIGYAENGSAAGHANRISILETAHSAEIGINESWAKEFLVNNDATRGGLHVEASRISRKSYKALPLRDRTHSITVKSAISL